MASLEPRGGSYRLCVLLTWRVAGQTTARASILALALTMIVAVTCASAQTITFGDTPPGQLAKDFEGALTGGGSPPRWEVVLDPTAIEGKALAQISADRTDLRFPLAIYLARAPADLEVSTRFKAISGKVDQAGGLVVRLADRDNYYVTRANALEDNVRFYRVVKGRRHELAGANLKVSGGEWHTLTLRAEGTRFTVSFDGKQLFTHADSTFTAPGKVALWTKADSVTLFESLVVKPLR